MCIRDSYWYYFQANGKALTNGDNTNIALKTINGKKYAFDEEGKMLYGDVYKRQNLHYTLINYWKLPTISLYFPFFFITIIKDCYIISCLLYTSNHILPYAIMIHFLDSRIPLTLVT